MNTEKGGVGVQVVIIAYSSKFVTYAAICSLVPTFYVTFNERGRSKPTPAFQLMPPTPKHEASYFVLVGIANCFLLRKRYHTTDERVHR